MADVVARKSITIGDVVLTYSSLIESSGLSDVSIKLSKEYIEKYPDPQKAAKHLIRSLKTKYVLLGLTSNLPNTPEGNTTKVTANACCTLISILTCLSIAHIAGFDAMDDEVQSFIMSSSVITAALKTLQPFAVEFGVHMTDHLIDCIPTDFIYDVNSIAGYRAITKRGSTGTINLENWEWVGGAVAGVATDYISSSYIGWRAYHTFFKRKKEIESRSSSFSSKERE